jgi:hypothetical protein
MRRFHSRILIEFSPPNNFKCFKVSKQGKTGKRELEQNPTRAFQINQINQTDYYPFTTIFTKRFGTTMIFTISLPFVYSLTLASAKAIAFKSSCEVSCEAKTRARSFPFI